MITQSAISPHAQRAANIAADWLGRAPIFLDTETTGVNEQAEICDIAMIDSHGQTLLNSLVRPSILIPAQATAIHGITNADVAEAPTYEELYPEIRRLLIHRLIIAYNARFDARMLQQSTRAAGITPSSSQSQIGCAMQLYAAFAGIPDRRRGGWKWHTLTDAAQHLAIPIPANGAHRAHVDAQMTLQLVRHLATLATPATSDTTQPPLI